MLPASITVTSTLVDAGTVVTEFAELLAILLAVLVGFYVVKSIPRWVKRSR